MKKTLLIITMLLACSLSSSVWAQTAQDSIATTSTEEKKTYRGMSYNGYFRQDPNAGGFEIGGDALGTKFWHLAFGADFASHSSLFKINLGWSKRKVFNDWFLLQGRLLPYIGWATVEIEDESDTEFTYGASADAQIGFKVYTQKDGTPVFLTGGYRIDAPEFETKNMFDYGYWTVGLTLMLSLGE